MAKVETSTSDVTFVLTMDAIEAQYVCDALLSTTPAHEQFNGDDPVWEALSDALYSSGVGTVAGAAK